MTTATTDVMDTITIDKTDYILDMIKTLNTVNYQLADLKKVKEDLEAKLCEVIGHDKYGQEQYEYGRYKVVIKTGLNYSIDTEEYEIVKNRIPVQFDVVRKSTKYEIDKKRFEEANKYADHDTLELLNTLITAKPSKLNVTIKAGV